MSTTVSNGTDTWTALIIDGYEDARAGRNNLIPILGTNERAVFYRPGALRTGSVRVLFESFALASGLRDALAEGETFTLADTDEPDIAMTFVLAGDAALSIEDETRSAWWVEFDFEEVA